MANRPHTFQTEVSSNEQHVLLLTQSTSRFVSLLKHKLQEYDNTVHIMVKIPHSFQPYATCIFLNVTEKYFKDVISKHGNKLVFIFFDNLELAEKCYSYVAKNTRGSIKILHLQTSFEHYEDDIEKIFWFCFSRNTEVFLPIHHRHRKQRSHHTPQITAKKQSFAFSWRDMIKPKNAMLFVFVSILLVHLLFIPVLALASYYHYKGVTSLRALDDSPAAMYAQKGKNTLEIARSLYSIVRPTYSLFSLGIYPDDMFILNESVNTVITTGISLEKQGQEFADLFFRQSKSPDQVVYMSALKTAIFQKTATLNQELTLVQAKMPEWTPQMKDSKQDLKRLTTALSMSERLYPMFDSLFAAEGEKKYLMLFANNMELRPGGGFIGSFAVVDVKNYTISNITVYDVYDADGQLVAHIRPPDPIREYLNQPHWFLRDSAFSPDFIENAEQAEFFLEKTMNMTDFDGVMLVTTSAVQNLLSSVGELYVPDFRERVTAENFYLKAQLYAEKDFFPGSIQKKTFLSDVMNQLLIELPRANPLILFEQVQVSFDEKQMVASFKDPALQKTFDDLYWSGRTIQPKCTTSGANCILDYIFPYDANLGVNKANFFISRSQQLHSDIQADGTITSRYTVIFKNDSFKDVFPGGPYKNYFQSLLPKDAVIQSVHIDEQQITRFDVQRGDFTTVGFLVEVPPQSIRKVKITYQLKKPIPTGSTIYQLIVQKQIGSANSDFQFSISLPQGTYVTNKNFNPVVKDNKILYNTTLSADKIFFIEFFKE